MERCGYELIPRDNPNPPPEMEALMEWMIGDTTALANNQPEFAMMRDMVALYKFLATMGACLKRQPRSHLKREGSRK